MSTAPECTLVRPTETSRQQKEKWKGPQKVALVTGATGLAGRHLILHMDETNGEWKTYAVARRKFKSYIANRDLDYTTQITANLLDAEQCARDLQKYNDITHIFHCAYTTSGDEFKDAQDNLSMLTNVVEAVEKSSKNTLKHVYLQAGAKWYGQAYMTKFKTPAKEDDLRAMPPMFYYPMQDYLALRVAGGASWTWSSLRPNPIIGFSDKSVMNLLNCIGVYGTLCRAMGLPFRFPGNQEAYEAVVDACDADILAQAMLYVATHDECRNQAFNVSNGDVYRWCEVWPRLADVFGLPVAPPQKVDLAKVMNTPEKKEIWQRLQKRFVLQDIPYENLSAELCTWDFMDYAFHQDFDSFLDVTKLRASGFHLQCLPSADSFIDKVTELRRLEIIPAAPV